MTSLMDLSNELKLLIITHLTAISPAPTTLSDTIYKYSEDFDSDSNLSRLPLIPIHAATPPTLVALSQTNTLFHSLLAPKLYATLTLQNKPTSGATVAKTASGEHARHVKTINYIAVVPLPADTFLPASIATEPQPSDFPEEVEYILSHLAQFPNLENVSIHFPFRLVELQDLIFNTEPTESALDIRTKESQEGWRALMTSSYTALAKNSPASFKSLILRNLVMKESSAWETEAWRSLLGSLTHFDVIVRGWENGAGWCLSAFNAYIPFIDNFDRYFFDHLANVTHLSIAANEKGPIGQEGDHTGPLHFDAKQMPYLQSISLDYVLISEAVLTLLQTHAKTVRTVHLKHAYAILSRWSQDLSWTEFFTSLLATTPFFPNLQTFIVESTLTGWEVDAEAKAAEEGETTGRLEGLERELLYIEFDGKYGIISTDANWRAYMPEHAEVKVRDWETYERFMQVIVANNEARGTGSINNRF
jgi:hypothetical protein